MPPRVRSSAACLPPRRSSGRPPRGDGPGSRRPLTSTSARLWAGRGSRIASTAASIALSVSSSPPSAPGRRRRQSTASGHRSTRRSRPTRRRPEAASPWRWSAMPRSLGFGSMEPDIRYARNGDVAIAYQVIGAGEQRPRASARLRLEPRLRLGVRLLARVLRTARALVPLIVFDKRGTGLSDRGGADGRRSRRGSTTCEPCSPRQVRTRRCVRLPRGRSNGRPLRGDVPGGDRGARALPVHRPYGDGSDSPYGSRRARSAAVMWGTQKLADQLLADDLPDPAPQRGRPALVRELAACRRQP